MNRKYKLIPAGKLFRLVSLIDMPWNGIKPGDYGGMVQNGTTLSQDGKSWVFPEAMALDRVQVMNDAVIRDKAVAKDDAVLEQNARLTGNAVAREEAMLMHDTHVTGNAIISGRATLTGNTSVYGVARIGNTAQVTSDNDWVAISGIGRLNSTATIYQTRNGLFDNHDQEELNPQTLIRTDIWTGTSNSLKRIVNNGATVWPQVNVTKRQKWRKQYLALAELADIMSDDFVTN